MEKLLALSDLSNLQDVSVPAYPESTFRRSIKITNEIPISTPLGFSSSYRSVGTYTSEWKLSCNESRAIPFLLSAFSSFFFLSSSILLTDNCVYNTKSSVFLQ